jgi:hypothetical protein
MSTPDNILGRVQAMLDRANHPDTPEAEREVCLAKAAQYMESHKITEAALRARNLARGIAEAGAREVTDEEIDWIAQSDEFYPVHVRIVAFLARLADVKIVFVGYDQLHVVGYRMDIDYFKMLWLSTHLTFSSRLYPKWSREKSAGDNIRTMVEAGYKWMWIWDKANAEGQPFMRKGEPVPAPPNDGGWMKRELAAAYKRTGEEKPKLSHGTRNYRNSYAGAFGQTFEMIIVRRLAEKERAARQAEGGAQIVLASDVDAVQKYFDKLYPPGRLGFADMKTLSGTHAGAAASGANAAASVDLSAGRGGVGRSGVSGAIGS